jgi:RNA polymerase I-specific transcription initiation factor RRN7
VENVGHTLQKRTFRKGERRNKRREEGRANAARMFIYHQGVEVLMIVYHGEEGEWLKLQALQLMLRLQVQKMREIWQLPEVFEVS